VKRCPVCHADVDPDEPHHPTVRDEPRGLLGTVVEIGGVRYRRARELSHRRERRGGTWLRPRQVDGYELVREA
jgi:hypothetical protein